MKDISIILVVEDSLSETVARKILNQSSKNYYISTCLCKGGFGYIKKKINIFNKASRAMPFLIIVDQDTGCPPDKIKQWFTHDVNPNLIFGIAVMEIESWVMAHRKAFADFVKIPLNSLPLNMDNIEDPKTFLINITKKSKTKIIKNDIIPPTGSTTKVGPNYNAQLSKFINNFWDVNEAINHSNSLKRAWSKIQNFEPIIN